MLYISSETKTVQNRWKDYISILLYIIKIIRNIGLYRLCVNINKLTIEKPWMYFRRQIHVNTGLIFCDKILTSGEFYLFSI